MTISNHLYFAATFFATLLLTACQSIPNDAPSPPNEIFKNQTFTLSDVETPDEIFRLSDDMMQQLDIQFPPHKRNLQSTRKLLTFLLDNGDDSLSYQSGATLIAEHTFRDLNANCLSLSILAFSMAEYLGMYGQFQQVHIPEYWSLNKGYNLLTGHINLAVSQPRNKEASIHYVYNLANSLIIDFDPNSRGEKFKTTPITKARITAMFYNNKGAAAMLNQRYDIAYSYYIAAIKADTQHSGSWGNLAVLFRLNKQYDNAEIAYNYAFSLDSNNNTALGNLALLYQITGRQAEAQTILSRLNIKRQSNPYYHVSLGNTAYHIKNYQDAIKHFLSAKRLDNKIHDSYFGLARTYYQLGDFKQAYKQLGLARKYADFDHDKQRYQGKLRALNNMTAKVNNH